MRADSEKGRRAVFETGGGKNRKGIEMTSTPKEKG
jgi:hypothetical protein